MEPTLVLKERSGNIDPEEDETIQRDKEKNSQKTPSVCFSFFLLLRERGLMRGFFSVILREGCKSSRLKCFFFVKGNKRNWKREREIVKQFAYLTLASGQALITQTSSATASQSTRIDDCDAIRGDTPE